MYSDLELMFLYLVVLRNALDYLTPEELEKTRIYAESMPLTGLEHGGAWGDGEKTF